MTLLEAIGERHSVRTYKEEQLSAEVAAALQAKIEEISHAGDLHFQLVLNEPKAFGGTMAYGRFRGVRNYLVAAGRKAEDLDERVGYYGEQLVLLAQTLGLNSCWVGLNYNKVPERYSLQEAEKVVCLIALGYGMTSGVAHKSKRADAVSNAGTDTPAWFRAGTEAACLAPTALNQQKFFFEYAGTGAGKPRVIARRGTSLFGYTRLDLGIAKLHFEIGAGRKHFDWA